MSIRLSSKSIGEKAVKYVRKYETAQGRNPQTQSQGKGIDMISGDRYIEIKGVMKKETNIRITNHTIDWVKNNGVLDQFYVYRVLQMASNPKLQIIKYSELDENEIKMSPTWIIQPTRLPENKVKEIFLEKCALRARI